MSHSKKRSNQILRVRRWLKTVAWFSSEAAAEFGVRIFTTPRRLDRPAWERELFVKAGGSRIVVAGDLQASAFGEVAAPAVLLVHGWEGRGLQLGMLVEPLVAQGFRVIALDGPAHGDSLGRRTNIGGFALKLRQVIDELRAPSGRVAGVVAHSFGASASALALAGGAEVEHVVFVAAPSSLRRVADNFTSLMEMNAATALAFRRRLEAWTGVNVDESEIAQLGARVRGRVSALVVHDPEDAIVPFVNAERFAAGWPRARVLPIPNVGHFKILKSPLFISAVSEFLETAAEPSQKTSSEP